MMSVNRNSQRKRSPKRMPVVAGTMRRLEDKDVRAVFESLHEGKPPPSNLKFKIVPVGPHGLKLSPPAFEFEDGLYVLLRPRKKNKNVADQPKAPAHLEDLVMHDLPPETCPWSLSGPQFPQPTAIQQRYCYPKGRAVYSSRKGGALWTMYRKDGKEDYEFRLLHVYFSPKRAVNKGVAIPEEEFLSQSPIPAKRARRLSHKSSSPASRLQQSPAITASSVNSSSLCSSPLSFDVLPPPSPANYASIHHMPSLESSNFISPTNDMFLRNRFHPVNENALLTPSPFRSRNDNGNTHNGMRLSPLQRSTHGHDDNDDMSTKTEDPFPCDMEASFHEIDSVWNDPLLTIMLQPSQDNSSSNNYNSGAKNTTADPIKSLANRLETLHESVREIIGTAPVGEQPALVSVLASWARQVAKDPLADMQQQQQQEEDGKRNAEQFPGGSEERSWMAAV